MDQSPSNRQLEALLQLAAQRLGSTPEALKQAAAQGDLSHLASGASGPEAQALQKVLSDPQAAKKLLSTPQAQKLFQMLGGKGNS